MAVITPPDRSERGAPTGSPLRNPTMYLAVVAHVLIVWSIVLAVGGTSPWLVVPLGAVARYLGFTVMHESVHGLAHRDQRINTLVAWLPAVALTLTPTMFRAVHLQHHAKTNDPDLDPDHDVGRQPRLLSPVWLLSVLWTYRRAFYGRQMRVADRSIVAQLVLEVVSLTGIVALIALGRLDVLLVGFVVPTVLAVWFLAWAFDYLPHRPYDSTERFLDTRAMPSRVLEVLFLGQNYHLVHHSWTSIPFWRYRRVFEARRAEFEAYGSPIGR